MTNKYWIACSVAFSGRRLVHVDIAIIVAHLLHQSLHRLLQSVRHDSSLTLSPPPIIPPPPFPTPSLS
ncbi:hypothetical protein CLOM_g8360 [Closterium sp. NIES-68]|nr:hypothetical protein CLOM_g8360 [Closterium sp. NIES-68]GJP77409.1 hypothetical protein CLOP_g7806 [Closterium sp. NIES-67]